MKFEEWWETVSDKIHKTKAFGIDETVLIKSLCAMAYNAANIPKTMEDIQKENDEKIASIYLP